MNYFDLTSLNHEVAKNSFDKFEILVDELSKLLIAGMVFRVGFSCGKDSSVVLIASIEAMRRCIDKGLIESDRPLVVITVDTLLEPYNIQMYVPFAHSQVQTLCDAHGINLHLTLASPPLHQQLMVLYAGTQKLFATSASGRNADCSKIWKVDVAKRALENVIRSLPKKYREGKWANISGVRIEESTRRKNNMQKRGEAGLTADMLVAEIRRECAGFKEHRFAPIADWDTRDVINCLNHAGDNPMKKMPAGCYIPSFGNNFGLLLAIYGEGSVDVCQVDHSGSCGGVARYGCQTCGMVSEDHSGRELLEYPRWARFGDDTLRLRDYLVRSSLKVENRAFHPKATCSVTSNVYLQPNVLKAPVLEYILYQAAQITVKHRQIHKDFAQQIECGDISSDIGVMDIQNDSSLRADVKRDYIAAYINRMNARPMLELFTEKHAVMLSALWSLHGVKSAPYRPMKILDTVKKGHRKPTPLLNSELNQQLAEQGKPKWDDPKFLKKEFPDALVYQLFSPARKFDPSITGEQDLAHWLPIDFTESTIHHMAPLLRDLNEDLIHRDRLRPQNALTLKVKYTTNGQTHSLSALKRSTSAKLNITEGTKAYAELLELAKSKAASELKKLSEQYKSSEDLIFDKIISENGHFDVQFYAELPFTKEFTSAFSGVSSEFRLRKTTGIRFTRRKRIKQKGGKFIAGRTSLQDYVPSRVPQLAEQLQIKIGYWVPDHKETRAQQFSLYDYHMDEDFVHNLSISMDFDDQKFDIFLNNHWARAISRHDNYVKDGYSSRLGSRKFEGTGAFHSLMRSSGLIMNPRFQAYVNRSLVRTEIFHASHLFNLSDFKLTDIEKTSHVITMDEHRSQKANQLLAIRHVRNIRRKEVRAALRGENQNPLSTTVSNRIIEFLDHFEDQAFAYAVHHSHQGLSNKNDLSLKGSVTQMWMNEFEPIALDPEALLKILTSKQELKQLLSDLSGVKAVFKTYETTLKRVAKSLHKRGFQVVDSLRGALENVGHSQLVGDDMGNIEFKDATVISPVVEAYIQAGATRNPFLTEMAFSNVLGASKGLLNRDQAIAESCYLSSMTNLESTINKKVSAINMVDYDAAIRKLVSLECRSNSITTLSQAKQDKLAALRAAMK